MLRRFALVCLCLLSVSVAACDSSVCAPEGVYVLAASRSADPGDCPTSIEDPISTGAIYVDREHSACGEQSVALSGNLTKSATQGYCTYQGTMWISASADGLQGHATVTIVPCAGATVPSCQARYDIAATRT